MLPGAQGGQVEDVNVSYIGVRWVVCASAKPAANIAAPNSNVFFILIVLIYFQVKQTYPISRMLNSEIL